MIQLCGALWFNFNHAKNLQEKRMDLSCYSFLRTRYLNCFYVWIYRVVTPSTKAYFSLRRGFGSKPDVVGSKTYGSMGFRCLGKGKKRNRDTHEFIKSGELLRLFQIYWKWLLNFLKEKISRNRNNEVDVLMSFQISTFK